MKRSEKTRQHVLDVGRELVATHGFTNLGLTELLKTAGVPKGSFYHYFQSKEHFGCELIRLYLRNYLNLMDEIIFSTDVNMRVALMQFWDTWICHQGSTDPSKQCLIVKLSAEVSDYSEEMRQLLADTIGLVEERLSNAIVDGIKDGSISPHVDAALSAQMLYQMWLGASLQAKLTRNTEPLTRARKVTDSLLPVANAGNDPMIILRDEQPLTTSRGEL